MIILNWSGPRAETYWHSVDRIPRGQRHAINPYPDHRAVNSQKCERFIDKNKKEIVDISGILEYNYWPIQD
jgi:hypothetical protein